MDTFESYFRREMRLLRAMGEDFSQTNPALARFLSADANDPDIEQLKEGFAFLTASLNQKVEDDLPEVTQPLLEHVWPFMLRAMPATTVL